MAEVIRRGGTRLAAGALLLLALVAPAGADPAGGNQGPDLSDCPNLQVPAGNKLAFHAYAEGVQVYGWNGARWVFLRPEAVLYAGIEDDVVVGIHYAGPTWESNSGSYVVGTVLERGTPDLSAIPWLLLGVTDSDGPGVFDDVTYIQRVNTVGGLAPAEPGTVVGEEVGVPYAADYFVYRNN